MQIEPLTIERVNSDFLDCLKSLKPCNLTVEQAKLIFPKTSGIYVAIIDDKVVGSATLLTDQKFIGGGSICGHIEDVAVHESFKGKGIGQALIAKLIEIGKAKGCYKIILDCKQDLVKFYEKSGFYQALAANMRKDLFPS